MSAICGYINFEKQYIDNEALEGRIKTMETPYKECAIDKYSTEIFDNGFFFCGVQFFKSNSKNEMLPIKDEKRNTVFVADAILNDREKLICDISKNSNRAVDELNEMPDGSLAYISWDIWGEDFVNYLQGLFAIAIYDLGSRKFYIYADHMGHRSIYYHFNGKEVFFSTLEKPIIDAIYDNKVIFDEKWITACESNDTPSMFIYPGLTPFKDIFQVCRGCVLKIDFNEGMSGECEIKSYWNPLNEKNKKEYPVLESMDYRKLFRSTFSKCIEDAIDTDGNVGAMVSSGLDSTSVSAVAATLLSKEGRKLFSYTSVPLPGFEYENDLGLVADESDKVKLLCHKYDNIEPHFISYQGKSAFSEMDRLVKMMEVPSKALPNLVWINEIVKIAAEGGCKTLLIGQFGNGTISYGRVLSRVYDELRHGHFSEAKKQLAEYGKMHGISRKELLRVFTSQAISKLSFELGTNRNYNNTYDRKYLKKDLLKKYGIVKYQAKLDKKYGFSELVSKKSDDMFILDEAMSQNINTYDTKLSLYYGIIIRDPTKDKRMIDFFIRLPFEQLADNGVERRLVREYLKDYVPDEIRLDYFHRGRQAADYVMRLKKDIEHLPCIESSSGVYEYFCYKNVQRLLNEELTENNAIIVLKILALNSFIGQFGKNKKQVTQVCNL